MSQRVLVLIAAVVFALIAIGHLLRIAFGVAFVVYGVSVPRWASGIAVVIMGYLAYEDFRLARKSPSGTRGLGGMPLRALRSGGIALAIALLWAVWWVFFATADAIVTRRFGGAITLVVVVIGIVAIAWKWRAVGGVLLILASICVRWYMGRHVDSPFQLFADRADIRDHAAADARGRRPTSHLPTPARVD